MFGSSGKRMLGADRYFLRAEKRMAQVDRGGKWLFSAIRRAAHHADQAGPIDLRGPLQFAWARIAEPRNVRQHQNVAHVVEAAAAGATEHLEKLIRLDVPFEVSRLVAGIGDENGAHRKIDPGREAHRRD